MSDLQKLDTDQLLSMVGIDPASHELHLFETREAWLAKRDQLERDGVYGASTVPTIVGDNPYQKPQALWEERIGVREPEDLSEKISVQLGLHCEPFILDWYHRVTAKEQGELIRFPGWSLVTSKGVPFFASPDGFYRRRLGGAWLLEAKFTAIRKGWEKQGTPSIYRAQAQIQMAVTGIDSCFIVACRHVPPMEMLIREQRPDPGYLDEAIERCEEFFEMVSTREWRW
jgi:putative phage-type endonuclease